MLRAVSSLLLVACATACLTACSAGDLGLDNAEQNDSDPDADTETDSDDIQDPEYEGPWFWRLDGSLNIQEGAVVPEGTVVEVQFANRDGSPWIPDGGGDPVTCALSATQVADGPPDSLDGEPLLGWWQIDTHDLDDDGEACPWIVPQPEGALQVDEDSDPFVLGLGPFDSRLSPALQAAGYSTALDLYSLYVLHPSPEGDVIYVFGIAGTDEQYAGEETTVDTVPIPNGDYELNTLVMLPVPDSLER